VRYLRLYLYFLRFSFSRAMEFRFDFFFRIVMDAIWYLVNLGFFRVLYLHTSLLGGWSEAEVLVFLATLFLSDAMHMTVFANNMWWFPHYVNRGDLDYYLVRPCSSLFFLSLRDFAANSSVNLLMTVGFAAWVIARHPEPLGVTNLLLYALLVPAGVVIHYLCEMLFLVPVFWTHQGAGLRSVHYALNKYSQYPDGIYTGWVRRVLTSIVPFAVIASFPTRALLAPDPWPVAAHMLAILSLGGAAIAAFWRGGLRSYASASS
jgi:ABC-2 type transport system permease protein